MEFRVLGPPEVLDVDGSEVRLPSAAQRRLTSVLLVHAEQIVSADRLSDLMGLSSGALRTSISRLRRLMGDDVVVTDGHGYRIRADRLDVGRFEGLLKELGTTTDPEARAGILRTALGLWRGAAHAEFAFEDWARTESRRLGELRAGAQESLAALLVEAGDHSSAISELEGLLAAEPYRDRPRELAMQALSRSGRRVEALRLFQEYRRRLLEEVGTEPSEPLVMLDRDIAVAGPPSPTPHHGLPAPSSSFIGRAKELAVVEQLVRDHRLVTLTGAGGTGKSRVALRVADELLGAHPGGTWFTDLSRVTDSGSVAEEIARSVGASTLPGQSMDLVVERIESLGPGLVLLDNAEHVLPGVASSVGALLERCREVRVLVASREPLGVPGETVWRLPTMDAPPAGQRLDLDELRNFDATRLFLERMRSARPDAVVDGDSAALVASICIRLDGLPLALELAAARTRTLQLRWILAGVDSSMAVLDPTPTIGDHHLSLRASIAWSVDLLERADREALGRLSVFRAPFTAEAAAAVAGPGVGTVTTLPVLVRLCDKSLIQFDSRTGRYRLLETIRRYGRDTLVDDEGWALVSSRHSAWFAQWCLELGDGAHGIERAMVLAEMPDVAAATAWARDHDPVLAMQMCVGLGSIRSTLGHHDSLVATWDWLVGADGPARTPLWASAVAALMASATGAGLDVAAVGPTVQAHLAPSDERAHGWLARGRAMVPAYRGDLGPVVAYSSTVMARADDVEASVYLGFAAYMLALGGRLDEADDRLRYLHRVVRRHEASFSVDTVGNGFAAEVLVAGTRGRLAEAVAAGEGSIPHDPAFSMTAASALAQSAVAAGDRPALERAISWGRHGTIPILRFIATELRLYRSLVDGDRSAAAALAEQYWEDANPVAMSRVHRRAWLNVALLNEGLAREARAGTDAADEMVHDMAAVPLLEAVVHLSKAQVACATGRTDDQFRWASALFDLARRHGFAVLAIDAQELLALAADRAGDRATAEQLVLASQAERERIGYRFTMVAPRVDRDALWQSVLGDRAPEGAPVGADVREAGLSAHTIRA